MLEALKASPAEAGSNETVKKYLVGIIGNLRHDKKKKMEDKRRKELQQQQQAFSLHSQSHAPSKDSTGAPPPSFNVGIRALT